MVRLYIEMDQNEEVLYKEVFCDPEVVLWWLNREVVKLLRETEDIYGTLNNLDEELVAKALLEGARRKRENRLREREENRKKRKKELYVKRD